MKTEQEKWIEETLGSLDGAGRAAMPASLREKLLALPGTGRLRSIPFVSGPKLWAMAAGLVLLLGLNIYAITLKQNKAAEHVSTRSPNPLSEEYFTITPSI